MKLENTNANELFIMKFLKNKNNDNLFLLIGCTSFIGTLVLSLILSIVYKYNTHGSNISIIHFLII